MNMVIIPALDIIDGKAVRLSAGDFNEKKIYHDDPVDVAKSFDEAGFKRLHLVDLDGARNKKITNLIVLEKISKATKLIIDFGGGVNSMNDVQDVLNAGASQCTIGSFAAKQPQVFGDWIEKFGADKFLLGADVLDEKIKISGWLEDAGISIFDFLKKMIGLGLNEFFCTDISRDGMMKGPSVNLYEKIINHFEDIRLIASGGVTSLADLNELKKIGCAGAIVGKAIYENQIPLKQLSEFQ